MPFPNQHSARIQSPGVFKKDSIRTVSENLPDGVTLLIGQPKDRPGKHSQAQSYRFNSKKFTAAEAKAWLKEHKIHYILFEPAADATKLSRTSALEAEHRTFRKSTLHTGVFKGESGGELQVTPERLAEIEQSFHTMKTNGVKVPGYATTHEQAYNDTHDAPARIAENCIGYITGAAHDGDGLDMLYDFADDEAVKVAKRVQQVSACIEPEFIDGEGRKYSHAITHVLLTPEPAMSNQDEFEKVACFARVGDSTTGAARFELAAASGSHNETRDALQKALDTTIKTETGQAKLDAVAGVIRPQSIYAYVVDVFDDYIIYASGDQMFKRGYSLDDKGAATLAKKAKEVVEERRYKPVPAQLSREGEPDMELKELVKELGLPEEADETACKAEIAKLKARPQPPVQLAREASEGLAEAADAKLALVVANGRITPAKAEKLQAALIGPADKRNVYALSRTVSGTEKALAFAVLDILGEPGEPVSSGEASGLQAPADAVLLQRGTGDEDPAVAKAHQKAITDEMKEEADKV